MYLYSFKYHYKHYKGLLNKSKNIVKEFALLDIEVTRWHSNKISYTDVSLCSWPIYFVQVRLDSQAFFHA